jgi:hypothetical protein
MNRRRSADSRSSAFAGKSLSRFGNFPIDIPGLMQDPDDRYPAIPLHIRDRMALEEMAAHTVAELRSWTAD